MVAAVAALVLTTGGVAAQAVTDTHVPFTFALENPCTGELFSGSGFFHVKVYSESEPNFHLSTEINVESAQATTLSGVRYVWTQQEASTQVADSDFAPFTLTFEVVAHFTRLGEGGTLFPDDDLYFRLKQHFTINANGVVTVNRFEITSECR